MIRLGISHNLRGGGGTALALLRSSCIYCLIRLREGVEENYFSSAKNWGDLFVFKISLDHFQTGQDINRIFAAEAIKKTVNGFGAE